jgi:hypothetical protein
MIDPFFYPLCPKTKMREKTASGQSQYSRGNRVSPVTTKKKAATGIPVAARYKPCANATKNKSLLQNSICRCSRVNLLSSGL